MSSMMIRSCLVLGFCSGLVSNGLWSAEEENPITILQQPREKNDLKDPFKTRVFSFLDRKGMAFVRTGCVVGVVGPAIYKLSKTAVEYELFRKEIKFVHYPLRDFFQPVFYPVRLAVAGGLGLTGVLLSGASFFNSNREGWKGWAKFGTGTVLGGGLSFVASVKFTDKIKAILPESVAVFYNPVVLASAGALLGGLVQFIETKQSRGDHVSEVIQEEEEDTNGSPDRLGEEWGQFFWNLLSFFNSKVSFLFNRNKTADQNEEEI